MILKYTYQLKIEFSFRPVSQTDPTEIGKIRAQCMNPNARILRIHLHKISGTQTDMHIDETKIIMIHS